LPRKEIRSLLVTLIVYTHEINMIHAPFMFTSFHGALHAIICPCQLKFKFKFIKNNKLLKATDMLLKQ